MTAAIPTPVEQATEIGLLQRRSVRVLVLSQAVGGLGITIGIATASLLATDIAGSEALSGLVQTAQVLGTAVISFLLAAVMARRGRRIGLVTGYLLGAAGGGLAVLAGVVGSMVLLLVGAVLLGAGMSANSAARFAATDLADDTNRGRSLSVVVWATTIGAVLGPNLTGPSGAFADAVNIPELTGPFAIGAFGMLGAALVVFVLLRPDPLFVARERAGEVDVGHVAAGSSASRAWRAVRGRPVIGFAIAGLSLAHAAMISVMVMTPLHMQHGGAELDVIGLVISVHVFGMYAFSPLVGMFADRAGRPLALGCGGLVLVAALLLCASSPEGMSWQVTAGLLLLGVGWSFAMVSASTMVAEHAPLDARTDVQGTSDLVMGVTAASAGALAGLVVDLAGYPVLALVTLALAFGVAGCAARARTAGTTASVVE